MLLNINFLWGIVSIFYWCFYLFYFFCGLLFPSVQLTRSQSPGRRRRTRHDEAACNIEEREGEEKGERGRRG